MPRSFATIVAELKLLDLAAAEQLQTEADQLSQSPTTLAQQRGLLTVDQTEVVETLLAPDEAIPGYEILSLLGMGGMGAVFRARQKNLDRLVALKTVLLSRGIGPTAVQRFEQEAVTLAKVVHPHVVSAYDFGKHDGALYLALELVEGEDMQRYSRRVGPLSEIVAWQLVRQAAAGLAHAAELGIIHRDIKPANLLLVTPPTGFPLPAGIPLVKIADFGLALLTTDVDDKTRLTTAGTAVGSPNYMSPEQLGGEPTDLRTDVYALGATAYQLLLGMAPFANLPLSTLVGKKLSTGPEPLAKLRPELSAATVTLVNRMLSIDREQRPASYRELLQAIDAIVDGANFNYPTAAMSASALAALPTQDLAAVTTAATTPPRDRRRLWLLAGVGVICSSGGLGWLWCQNERRVIPVVPGDYRPDQYAREFPLFTGEGVNGWRNLSGEWKPAKDGERATILSGSRGSATRILSWDAMPPSDNVEFRVTLIVEVHQANLIRLEFDRQSSTRDSYELIVGANQNTVVHLRDGRILRERQVPRIQATAGLVVQFVRRQQDWLVLVDEQPAATLSRLVDTPPRLRIAVEGGPAWFSDISIAPRSE